MKSQLVFLLLVTWVSVLSTCCLGLSSEFSILNYDEELLSDERVEELFKQWKEKHGKIYERVDDAERKLDNFRENLKYVIERNSRNDGTKHVVGLNKFADLSNEEFNQIFISKIKKPFYKSKHSNKTGGAKEGLTCEAPASLDWRNKGVVTPIKDQGECGSCWAFSSTGAMEGINALKTGDLISLSEQELVDCDPTNEGCDGGLMDLAFEWVIDNGGIDSESNYPYASSDGIGGKCNIAKEETKVVSIDGYVDVAEEESALLCAVVQQPISVGIDGGSLDFQLYTGGIFDGECSSNPDDIDHAVLIVGYGSKDGEDYWIVKNSWGTSWGVEGYIYMKRNTGLKYGLCGINAMASYPTKASVSPSPYPSPVPPPPPPPPPSPPPPTPPGPSPSQCGDFSFCPASETCCCIFEFYDFCLIYGCCGYENAVCCAGTSYCCPQDYPICDVDEGLCFQSYGDVVGIAAKKRTMAKHKLPWTKNEGNENQYQPLQWKRNRLAAVR